MFSFVESISFIWLYTFSKDYRKAFLEKWNDKVGIKSGNKIILVSEIIFSIMFNTLIIGAIIYLVFSV